MPAGPRASSTASSSRSRTRTARVGTPTRSARRSPWSTAPATGRGPYRIQAELAAVHATALDAGSTDWLRIVALYDELLAIHPSPIVALNRAVAVGMSDGPLAGLRAIDAVDGRAATTSTSCRRLGLSCWLAPGDHRTARDELGRAIELAPSDAGATTARSPARRARRNVGLSRQLLA